ncbi:hypothetical protein SEVIR_1G361901v4 [Setaria viridis]|uniref:Uncharacterized protein n=2 Tax=Setaria TaxID=4554 RepID=A0A368PT27_SETIT|nr:uncharacterized protein LOC117844363 [Setaria viridis]RCV08792.1 hypothetical protein SETIT_1G355200v2 [Setaria italica]TKW42100.1 hypothetical protein SEVIR_1G361901v2 [Setaria viridis]
MASVRGITEPVLGDETLLVLDVNSYLIGIWNFKKYLHLVCMVHAKVKAGSLYIFLISIPETCNISVPECLTIIKACHWMCKLLWDTSQVSSYTVSVFNLFTSLFLSPYCRTGKKEGSRPCGKAGLWVGHEHDCMSRSLMLKCAHLTVAVP